MSKHYLFKRGNTYYFNRATPARYQAFHPGGWIRISLKTDSRKTALKLAAQHNDRLERYWRRLAGTGQSFTNSHYKELVESAAKLGFAYHEASELSKLSFETIAERMIYVDTHGQHPGHVEALLGGQSKPIVRIGKILPKFWEYTKGQLLNKSELQIKKWKNPRERAMRNFIKCIGPNKALHELTREDMLRFKSWWIERIEKEKLICATANHDFKHVKSVLTMVAENMKIRLDKEYLFGQLRFKEDDSGERHPFETDYIVNTLLAPHSLTGLNAQAKYALYAMAETGAGISELVGLLPEEIHLDDPIPYIEIAARKGKGLKTKYRNRKIPLVGYALEAFKALPNGFTDYFGRPDSLSTALGKYLSENKLFPTNKHSVYSLRHSFQDRLLEVNAPDRVQADLMGHKFPREAYGKGSTLEKKFEWVKKIQLAPKIDKRIF